MKHNITKLIPFAINHIKIYKNVNTIRTWKSFINVLSLFDTSRKKDSYSSFDMHDYSEFKSFLLNENYWNNTISFFTDKLKAIIRAASRQGYIVSADLRMMECQQDESQAIYLTMNEIKRIYSLKLKGDIDLLKDRFVIGCLTGLRFSDYSRLDYSNVNESNIYILNKKTNTKTVIPMHPLIFKIFKKYKNNLPAPPCHWYFNKCLALIGCKAKINDKVVIERSIGGKIVIENYFKHELITTHTARRSAATNMYLAGIPVFRIMLITGHSTEQSFFKYIRIRKEENAQVLAESSFFKR